MVQLTSVHDYWKNHSFGYTDLLHFISCLLMSFLWFRDPILDKFLHVGLCVLYCGWVKFFCAFYYLAIFEKLFCRMTQFGFVCCFLMIEFRLCGFFGQYYHRTDVSFTFFHIGKDLMWIFPSLLLLTFDRWLRWCLLGLSFVKLLFFFLCLVSIIWGDNLETMWMFLIIFLHSDVHNSDNSIY